MYSGYRKRNAGGGRGEIKNTSEVGEREGLYAR